MLIEGTISDTIFLFGICLTILIQSAFITHNAIGDLVDRFGFPSMPKREIVEI